MSLLEQIIRGRRPAPRRRTSNPDPKPRATDSQPRAQAAKRKKPPRQIGPLTIGEIFVLLLVVSVAGALVFSSYYITRKGVPPFAAEFKPTIESVTGKLPIHVDEKIEPPTPAITPKSAPPTVDPTKTTEKVEKG